MVDFSKLKANRAQNTQKAVEALNQKSETNNEDSRFWKPTLDKEKGSGGAVIRFLPSKDEGALGYVTYYEHAFKGPTNKWYIERSLSSIGGKDSVASINARLWATNQEANKAICRRQKRQTRYVANILVVNDPAHPEFNGKTFLYRFGPMIFGFVEKALKPVADAITGKTPDVLDAFDMWEGADFELRIKDTKDGWNYGDSKFADVSPVADNDSLIEAVYNQTLSLAEFVDNKNYKSVADLDKRLIEVLGLTISGLEVIEGYGKSFPSSTQQQASAPAQASSETPATPAVPFDADPVKSTTTFGSSEDEDFFNDLMKDNA
jgi:hypothetical protein